MTPARPLTAAEREELARKLARMQAAVDRKATTRRLHAIPRVDARADARAEEQTRNDLPPVSPGRYSLIGG